MKAFNVMMFLLIFNVVISLIGFLHIYQMGDIGAYNVESMATARGESTIWFFLGQSAIILFMGAIAGAVAGAYLMKIPTSEGAAYGFFGTLIGIIFIGSYNILWSLVRYVPKQAQPGVAIIVGLFLGITGIMFAFGFLQLVRGGIKSMV